MSGPSSSLHGDETTPTDRPSRYAWYVLAALTAVQIVSYIDRQILVILAEPIKRDLGFTDTQLGFLTGFAFAVVYSTFGVVIARLADQHNRINIVSLTLAFWSIMTALCGFASTFVHMLLARMGVALGEAGTVPPAHSLISDYFSENRRAFALSFYTMGVTVGAALGYLIGGWINDAFGWRTAFWVVGAPGLVLALVVRATVRDPRPPGPVRRGGVVLGAIPRDLWAAFKSLWRLPAYRFAVMGFALYGFAGWGLSAWSGVYLIRVHGLSSSDAGFYLFAASMIAGTIGTLTSGLVTDRLVSKDRRFYFWIPGVAMLAIMPVSLALFTTGDAGMAVGLMFPWEFCSIFVAPPVFAAVVALAPKPMRATAVSINLLLVNFVGMGLGPQIVGVLSDAFAAYAGDDSLRYALCIVSVAQLAAAVVFFAGAKTLRR